VFTSVLLAAMGCEEPNSLKGSITDSHDLAFDTVRLRLFTDQQAYELRYEKALEGGAQDIVAKLVFDVPEGGIVLDKAIDLLPLGGQVERITAKNDPFPGVERADVTFTAGGVDDGDGTTGAWGATFDNGKTINGTFDVTLEHASFESSAGR
jgi:hypothetical protein